MDGNMFDGIGNLIISLAVSTLVLLIISASFGLYMFLHDDVIKSEKPIEPEMELIIENNQVDTLYVYRPNNN